ncbi:MAG TPA: NAD(P)/FAD-dependent oxidoreductase [Methylophilaceae bacterium]|nr:NAD(P)/FAD-dependent oxidoreductase [Methylophilaceae bacterium]
MNCTYDAVIIGAGPAGSTAAILLAQAGWSVAIVEKQPFPRRKVCGECIAATNMPLMEKLGVADDFERLAGKPLRRVALMLGERTIVSDLPALPDTKYAWGRALSREHLDLLLLQKAATAGADILQPWTVKAVRGSFGDFQCGIASKSKAVRTLKASYIIAAQGSWEAQTFVKNEKTPQAPSDLFAFKANFLGGGLQPNLLPVLAFAGGYGGMVVDGDNVLTLACCIRRDTLKTCRTQFPRHTAAESVEAYLRASCSGVEKALGGARRRDSWLSVGPLRPGIRLGKAQHEFLLVGNAAAEAHPIIGEGISMAMQSSWLLCERLIAYRNAGVSTTFSVIQEEYVRAWRSNFVNRLRLAALFAHVAMRPRLGGALLPLLQRWPEVITQGAYMSGKVRPLRLDQQIEELS